MSLKVYRESQNQHGKDRWLVVHVAATCRGAIDWIRQMAQPGQYYAGTRRLRTYFIKTADLKVTENHLKYFIYWADRDELAGPLAGHWTREACIDWILISGTGNVSDYKITREFH